MPERNFRVSFCPGGFLPGPSLIGDSHHGPLSGDRPPGRTGSRPALSALLGNRREGRPGHGSSPAIRPGTVPAPTRVGGWRERSGGWDEGQILSVRLESIHQRVAVPSQAERKGPSGPNVTRPGCMHLPARPGCQPPYQRLYGARGEPLRSSPGTGSNGSRAGFQPV